METKELSMIKVTKRTDKIQEIFESLSKKERKILELTITSYISWFDLFSRDSNRWMFSKIEKINDSITCSVTMGNCENLFNYHQFEPEITISINCTNGDNIRVLGSGVMGGCLDEEIHEFQDIIKNIHKSIKKNRSSFKMNLEDHKEF